jgi:hypothetical protein
MPTQAVAPDAAPAVRVTNLRVAWTTANSIGWEWDVSDAPPDQLAAYELVIGSSEHDVVQRKGSIVIWDAAKNPELGHYLLPRTRTAERVRGTITGGHAPGMDYWAQLIAQDHQARRAHSAVVRARTSYAIDEAPLVPPHADPRLRALAAWMTLRPDPVDGAGGLEAVACCRRSPDGGPPACDEGPSCYENLRLLNPPARLARISEGTFETTAFLEFAVTHDSKIPSTWSEVWLGIGSPDPARGFYRYRSLVFPANARPRLVQIPLRVLRNERDEPLTFATLREADFVIDQFNVGGLWTPGARVLVDDIRIRW